MLRSLYPAALVLALVPLVDPLAQAWPFHPGDSGWRFLLVSTFIDHGAMLLAGLVVAVIAAVLLDGRLALRRLGLTALILSVLLLLLVVLLVVQMLLLQRDFGPALQIADFGITRRVIEGILLGLAFLGLGLGARRAVSALPENTIGTRRTSDRIAGM
ncbi:MAG TPA: hypothetical protein VGP80_08550 [Gemmatimonadales bacterium]|nr:hypothetical protein [Gemmatimonadales bacterium]